MQHAGKHVERLQGLVHIGKQSPISIIPTTKGIIKDARNTDKKKHKEKSLSNININQSKFTSLLSEYR